MKWFQETGEWSRVNVQKQSHSITEPHLRSRHAYNRGATVALTVDCPRHHTCHSATVYRCYSGPQRHCWLLWWFDKKKTFRYPLHLYQNCNMWNVVINIKCPCWGVGLLSLNSLVYSEEENVTFERLSWSGGVILIGMELESKLLVSLLQVLLCTVLGNTEYLVVIFCFSNSKRLHFIDLLYIILL